MLPQKQIQEIIEYWIKSSEEALKTADTLLTSKRYLHCLFFCHLFIEKTLKGLVVKNTKDHPPYIHKLTKLAQCAELSLTESQLTLLDELTAFNIEARYDSYKFELYHKANKTYTKAYLTKAKELYLWLRKKA